MQFLVTLKLSGQKRGMGHEFRCPLERATFVREFRKRDPTCVLRLRQRVDCDDCPPADEAHWYSLTVNTYRGPDSV